MPSILLDTNILVYSFDVRQPAFQTKAKALIFQMESVGAACLSVQCLGEFFRVTTAKLHLSPAEMVEQVAIWRQIFPVFDLTSQIILEAARGVRDHQLAYYDAQIWASARLNQIPVVFSEDFQDGQTLEGVQFANPFASTFNLDEWF
ncbi:MAG: PIN domain-containing protein [Anaerolineales bacterium]|jgi:predicted nucleic acid-binding protein|nr:PIN domain-containing protein [Anaerolineales bacterium]